LNPSQFKVLQDHNVLVNVEKMVGLEELRELLDVIWEGIQD
jgi:hypothetical protein